MLNPVSKISEQVVLNGWGSAQVQGVVQKAVGDVIKQNSSMENVLLLDGLVNAFLSRVELPEFLPPELAQAVEKLIDRPEIELQGISELQEADLKGYINPDPLVKVALKMKYQEELLVNGLSLGKTKNRTGDAIESPDIIESLDNLLKANIKIDPVLRQKLTSFKVLLDRVREDVEVDSRTYLRQVLSIRAQRNLGKSYDEIINATGAKRHAIPPALARQALAGSVIDGRKSRTVKAPQLPDLPETTK